MGNRKIIFILAATLASLCYGQTGRQDTIVRVGYSKIGAEMVAGAIDKVDESDGHTTVFPIPGSIITLNPNIVQNKGY